ncbi:hypothetical protein, partial [Burkholderia cenocepacia]|uniref:hypothetical protein n=1 Tax=Burkholderia cenocepacia TaxID=95486 RepID=UPI000667A87C
MTKPGGAARAPRHTFDTAAPTRRPFLHPRHARRAPASRVGPRRSVVSPFGRQPSAANPGTLNDSTAAATNTPI